MGNYYVDLDTVYKKLGPLRKDFKRMDIRTDTLSNIQAPTSDHRKYVKFSRGTWGVFFKRGPIGIVFTCFISTDQDYFPLLSRDVIEMALRSGIRKQYIHLLEKSSMINIHMYELDEEDLDIIIKFVNSITSYFKEIKETGSRIIERVNESMSDRLGKCYMLSYRYVSSNRGWNLVHGYITDSKKTGRTIDHAWAEKGTKVHDPVVGNTFDSKVYYLLFGAEKVKEYSQSEAMSNALKSGHYGPWHTIDKNKIKFP